VERLHADGWDVRALVRDAAAAARLERAGATLEVGDVLDTSSVARAAAGCAVVFHAAAVVVSGGGWDAYRRLNVDGTRAVIDATAAAGARLLHVSSVAVYGPSGRYGRSATTEDAPLSPLPESAHYARSKRESEALVLDAHAAGRVWASAIRPDVIYGRHDRQFVPRVARLLRTGVVPLLDGGRSTLAIVHAANVAHAAVLAATTSVAAGRAYNVANDGDVTVAEFMRLAADALGRRLHTIHVPGTLVRLAVRTAGGAARLVGRGDVGTALATSVDFLTRDNPFSSARAERELGWRPVVAPADGIRDAFAWAR
jgi:nucleoside-diphosphate-sugar epimerase